MLKTQDLHAYYGPIEALKGIDITVKEGQIACLIGSNGAGKTTLLNAISGMIKTTGSISWANRELTKMSCTQIAKFGIMHVPSGRHVFPGLTVRENLEVGTINWRGPFGRAEVQGDLRRSMRCSRASKSARRSWLGACPAASSRCCRRTRADGKTQDPSARRAVYGSCARGRGGAF